MTAITTEETALYDRQIRLWGLESQTRIRNTRVIIFGADGLAAELAKNLTLVGIKSLHIMDDLKVSEEDLYSQFFLTHQEFGQNRAVASCPKIQRLNPLVAVHSTNGSLASILQNKEEAHKLLSQFDVVCLVGQRHSHVLAVDTLCRELGIKCFAARAFGLLGLILFDLGPRHRFTEPPDALELAPKPKSKPSTPRLVENSAVSIAIDEEDGLATSADGANGSHAASSSEAAHAGSKRSHPTNTTDDDEDLVLFDSQPDREAAASSNKRARADETAETRSDAASAEATTAPTTTKEAMPTFKETSFVSFEELFARKLSADKGHQASISSSRRANDYHGGIFYVLLSLLEFEEKHRNGDGSLFEGVKSTFTTLAPEELRTSSHFPLDRLLQLAHCGAAPGSAEAASSPSPPPSALGRCPLAPTCAVLGGLLAQEVVKAVAANAAPFRSMLVYNGLLGDARLYDP